MKLIHFASLPCLFITLCTAAAVAAPATQPSAVSPDVLQQLRELRDQVRQLTANQKMLEEKLARATTQPSQRVSGPSADEVRGEVMRDADLHSQMFDIGDAEAGYDPARGFYLASSDGNFLFRPFMLLQVRDVTDFRRDVKTGGDDNTDNGFEIRRFQWGAEGNLFSPDLTYRFFLQTDRQTGVASLFDAWAKYRIGGTPWYVEAGQFKAPLDHEQMVSDRTQLAVDRTLTDDILAKGEAFSDGVMAIYDNDGPARFKWDFTNGYGVNDLNYQEPPNRPYDFGTGGRLEYKAFGNWRDYDEFTAKFATQDQLVFGGGADLSEDNSSNAFRHSIDVQYITAGSWTLYAAYLGMYTSNNPALGMGKPTHDTYDSSLRAQAAYAFPHTNWEAFGRYDWLYLDGKEFVAGTHSTVNEVTGGATYYFYGQNAKFTIDLSYLPNGSPVEDNGDGILVDNGDAQWVFRGQFQLAF